MSFLSRSQFQWDEARTMEIFLQNVSFYGGLIFQFPLQQQIGRPFCRPLSKTSAENFSQCWPTLDTTCHLQIVSHLFNKFLKGRVQKRSCACKKKSLNTSEWEGEEKRANGHGLWRKRGEMRWIIGGRPTCLPTQSPRMYLHLLDFSLLCIFIFVFQMRWTIGGIDQL